MFLDDLKKLLTSPTLLRLDSVLSPRLVPVFYAVGIGAIGLWAIGHFVSRFSTDFGNGLWGLLEIGVYGTGALIVLRIVCEALLVFFKTHEEGTAEVARTRVPSTLLEEVRDAIHDLAEDDDDGIVPATEPAPFIDAELIEDDDPTPRPIKRTARRTPKA